jgi:hypothetical protein
MTIKADSAPAILYLQTANQNFAGRTSIPNMAPGRLSKVTRLTGAATYLDSASWLGTPLGMPTFHTRTLLDSALGKDFVINGPDYDVVYLNCIANWTGSGTSPNIGLKQMLVQGDGTNAIGLTVSPTIPSTSLFSYGTHTDQVATSVYYASEGVFSNGLTEAAPVPTGSLNVLDVNIGSAGTTGASPPNGLYKGRLGNWTCSPFSGETLVAPNVGDAYWFAMRFHKQTGDGVYRVSFATSLWNSGTTSKTISIIPLGSKKATGTPCSAARDLNATIRGEMILAWDIGAEDWLALIKQQGDVWKDGVTPSTKVIYDLEKKRGNYLAQVPNFPVYPSDTTGERLAGNLEAGHTCLIEGGVFSTINTPFACMHGKLSSWAADSPNNVNTAASGVFLENFDSSISVRQRCIFWGDNVNGDSGRAIGTSAVNQGGISFVFDPGAIGANLAGCKIVVKNPTAVPVGSTTTPFTYTFDLSPVGINGGKYEAFPFSDTSGS